MAKLTPAECMRSNPWLYARILRLTHLLDPCLGADGSDLNSIVREVIMPDRDLIWC